MHDETQLTKALRELMRAQPPLAHLMVRGVLESLNRGDEAPGGMITVEGEKPASVERWLRAARPVGRTDWVFRAPDDDFELIVEVKIGHVVTEEQVTGYAQSLKGKRGGVVLLTRDPTSARIDNPRFLGRVGWHDLVPRLLAARPPSSIEHCLWQALLEQAVEPGGLGRPAAAWATLDSADPTVGKRILADVARSAMDELISEAVRTEPFRGTVMRRGRTASRWATLEMNDETQKVFSFELAFDETLRLEAWAWPPRPRRGRQGLWADAIRAACRAGWQIDGTRLRHPQSDVPRSKDLVADVLARLIPILEPLAAPELLHRYRGVRDAKGATAADLAQVR